MSFLVSFAIIFQTISLHYSGDTNVESLLFSETNEFRQVKKCVDDCVSIDVKGKKITLLFKKQGEVFKRKYDFSKNKVSGAQFADLLRLKIILFKKEHIKKIEKKFTKLLKAKLRAKIKTKANIKYELDEILKTIKEYIDFKLKNAIPELKEELRAEFKAELKKELILELKKELRSGLASLSQETRAKSKVKEIKKEETNFISFGGELNYGIDKNELNYGFLLNYKRVNNNSITDYSLSFLTRGENKNKSQTNFILLKIATGQKIKITSSIDFDFTIGGFSAAINLKDKNDEWFWFWDTSAGGFLGIDASVLFTPNWGINLKSDLSLYLINYRNTNNDGLYGNKKLSGSFSLNALYKF